MDPKRKSLETTEVADAVRRTLRPGRADNRQRPEERAEESVGSNSKETGPEQLEISRLTLASGALTRSPRERDRDHS